MGPLLTINVLLVLVAVPGKFKQLKYSSKRSDAVNNKKFKHFGNA